jgi:hypothetical protein
MPRIGCLTFFEYPSACLFVCLFCFVLFFFFGCFVLCYFSLCVHFIFEKFQKDKKYFNLVIFISSFFCLMHLECPLCAHVSSMDLIPCVLKSFQYA